MKIKYLLPVIAIVAFTQGAFAQFSQDAITFSSSQNGPTSRVKALGGAGTSLGGDLSSIQINPAGIAFFTKSELSLTPEYSTSKTNSFYYTTSTKSDRNNFNLSNAAIVFYSPLSTPAGADKEKGWLSVNFGASYNRTNNFNYRAAVIGQGSGNGSSIADYYAELGTNTNTANGSGTAPNFPGNSLEGYAYNQGLIVEQAGAPEPGGYFIINPNVEKNPLQRTDILRRGGQSEFNLSLGANHSNKLYLGFGLGINHIDYSYSSIFNESGDEFDRPNSYVTSYTIGQATKGTGYNGKFGAIYKFNNTVRIGANITTPTWYVLDDVYSETVQTKFSNTPSQSNGNDYGTRYTLITPFKASAGMTVFAGKYGFITGDVEYVDYANTELRSDDYDVNNDNRDIAANYKSAVNVRVGAEARLNNVVFLRGGYNIQGTPQKELQNSIKTASGGVGFRLGAYYVDATYTHSSGTFFYAPYLLSNDYMTAATVTNPYADIKRSYNNVYLTLGYRF